MQNDYFRKAIIMKTLLKAALMAAGILVYLFATGFSGLLVNVALLVFGFVLLIKGADWFVDAASGIADKLGVSQLVIGLTIVAFGTSAPEAAVSITAALAGKGDSIDIAIGNVLGSNIMNVLLILGLASIICPLAVQKQTRRYEIPFVIFITAAALVMGFWDGEIGRIDGIILLCLMAAFMIYLLISAKKNKENAEEEEEKNEDSILLLLLCVVIGGVSIVMGSNITVSAATVIAEHMGMSDRLIGLTVVAFGTSLPELITSCMAAARKKADIAIGNIVGSNIFNLLFVMAITAVITPLPYGIKIGEGFANGFGFLIDNIAALVTVIILFLCVLNKDSKLKRWGGLVMLLTYAGYFTYLLLA